MKRKDEGSCFDLFVNLIFILIKMRLNGASFCQNPKTIVWKILT